MSNIPTPTHFNYSMYIPRILSVYDENMIREKMSCIGFVKYVDFAPIHPTAGFADKKIGNLQSAFVHLVLDYNNESAIYTVNYLLNNPYKFWISNSEYWLLLENKNPIPRTWMNIHQIVDNCRLLEEKAALHLEEKQLQDEKIAILEKEVLKQQEQIKELIIFCYTNMSAV